MTWKVPQHFQRVGHQIFMCSVPPHPKERERRGHLSQSGIDLMRTGGGSPSPWGEGRGEGERDRRCRTPQNAARRAEDTARRDTLSPAISFAAILLLLAFVVGCASPRHIPVASNRPFNFQTDTFAFPNELTWTYEYDAQGKWTTHTRKPKPDYSQHCFVIARSTRQFYLNARFDASEPVADQATYRRLIQRVVSSNPRKGRSDIEKIVIPGFPNLRSFSQAQENLLKAECGPAWQSYVQRGHWRIVFPFSRRHQQNTARVLLAEIAYGRPVVVHLVRFPQLTINHALVVFGAKEEKNEIQFLAYDPNRPAEPRVLNYDRASRTFLFAPNDYFPGGRVDVYQVYHK